MKSLFPTVLACVVVVNCVGGTFPEPAVVQTGSQWTLGIEYDQPQQIMVRLPGQEKPGRFWYIILTLTNNGGNTDASFYPLCDLMTDTFKVVPAGKGVRSDVFRLIKLRHQGSYPFLVPIDEAANKILQGEDNTVDVAIIWPDFDVKAKEATLFIAGLSNEAAAIAHPAKKNATGGAEMVYLRKTLALTYTVGGDPQLRDTANLKFKEKSWVMR